MKFLLWLVWLPVVVGFSSCASHPCGQAMHPPKKSDFKFTHFGGKAHGFDVAVTPHAGAPLLITHGLGGLDPATLEWAKKLGENGWQVYMPLLDGPFNKCDAVGHYASLVQSGRWTLDKPDSSGPVLDDVAALADWISARHHRRIVVVGNCLTGGFPLALLGRPTVKTAVLCQPAMPLKTVGQVLFNVPQSPADTIGFGIPKAQLNASLHALQTDSSKHLYGFHYLKDHLAPFEKFTWLHQRMVKRGIGARFKPIVLVPKGAPDHQPWWERLDTTADPGFPGTHVTLTGAEMSDRTRLQRRFDELVRP
ncbi:MAG: hypothetical protein P4L99_13260 [Chthoniobacter sp.]|nr:hypothetical protein [Chthoniobacter sp.]